MHSSYQGKTQSKESLTLSNLVKSNNQHVRRYQKEYKRRSKRKRMQSILKFVAFFMILLSFTFMFLMHLSFSREHIAERDDQDRALIEIQNKTREKPVLNNKQRHDVPQNPKATIAYAISLTSCGDDEYNRLTDGAAVLKHSIHKNSFESYESSKSMYSYHAIAFVHPKAKRCAGDVQKVGFEVMEVDTPVDVSEIKGDFLREHVVKSGCCGEKEYIKLWAYTLDSYPVVVHLDIDSLLTQPLDDLFDVMIDKNPPKAPQITVMYERPLPSKVDAFFTRDYNMVRAGKEKVGVQGGFLVLRPSRATFDEYVSIILEGNFQPYSGWGNKGYGGYWGAQQIQGIVAYYYDHVHPGTAVELNRCVYNSMADNPRDDKGKCRDGRDLCEDCRGRRLEDVRSIHYTLCQKPWLCSWFESNEKQTESFVTMCNSYHKIWHETRRDLEEWLETTTKSQSGTYRSDHFMGHCKFAGKKGYLPLFP